VSAVFSCRQTNHDELILSTEEKALITCVEAPEAALVEMEVVGRKRGRGWHCGGDVS